ncbi:MAG: purine-binding chemotaxis protein CheW [Acidobacteria bacterium]|nr:purine-binding chemotaxis protein CheW [Acidobacteriota bacterium]
MDDRRHHEPEIDPSSLLEDWLASPGDAMPPPAPAPGESAEAPPLAGGDGDRSLLDALSSDAAAPLAADAAPAEAASPRTRLILFGVAGSMYGVSQALVSEVARVPGITAVPHVPAWVRGVVNLRGDVVSVIDLRALLGLEAVSPYTGRLLVVRLADEEFTAGLLVDSVEQIVGVALDSVKPPSGPIEGALAPYLTGVSQVGERLVAVLDLERLLRSADIRQFEDRREEASCEART